MELLSQDVLANHVFPYVGNEFLLIASVNRAFYQAASARETKLTRLSVATTLEIVHLCYAELVVQSQAPPSRKEIVQSQIFQRCPPLGGKEKICLLKELLKHCVKMGRFDWVQYLHQVECPWDATVCSTAAYHGHLDILQFLRAHGCPWDQRTTSSAASQGHFELFQWACRNGCPWDKESTEGAARNGHLRLLKWAAGNGCSLKTDAILWAAESGQLRVVQWLRSYGLSWAKDAISFAAMNGHLDVVKWAYENGCDWDEMICSCAASNGHLNVLQWAHENMCYWDELTCAAAAAQGEGISLELDGCSFMSAGSRNVPRQHYMDVLRFAYENFCPWSKETCANAAYTDDLELLQFAHENGCPWDHETCANAAEKGNLKVLKYAHENGCPWNEETCSNAALQGLSPLSHYFDRMHYSEPKVIAPSDRYLNCLQYAHENGCPWNKETCAYAAMSHVKLLQYAHSNGCPWDKETCFNAAFYGNLEALKYAHENGCPWDEEVFNIAEERGHLNILQYLHDVKGPWKMDLVSESHETFSSMCFLHCMGLYFVECPIVPDLNDNYNVEKISVQFGLMDVLRTHGVKATVCICEGRVIRLFHNPNQKERLDQVKNMIQKYEKIIQKYATQRV